MSKNTVLSLDNSSKLLNAGTQVTKQLLNNKSERLAGAINPDYTKKEPLIQLRTSNGAYSSVSLKQYARLVDPIVRQQRFDGIGNLSLAEVKNTYGQELSNLLGQFNDGQSMSNRIGDIFSKIDMLVNNPSNARTPSDLKDSFLTLTVMLNDITNGIQDLRAECEKDIGLTVTQTNNILKQVQSSNDKLNANYGMGADSSRLMDSHDALLSELATYLPITVDDKASGASYIATPFPLILQQDKPISFQGGTIITPPQYYNIDGTGTLQGIKDSDGNDVTFRLTRGKLGGLIHMRDTALPEAQNLIDNLTASLISEFNAISNQGTTYTPERVLTGERVIPLATGDATPFTAQGTLRVALIDRTNHTITTHTDIDLTTLTTIGDMRSAFATVTGLTTSYDADGHLILDSNDDNLGISLVSLPGATSAQETITGKNLGISHYFGFNNVFSASGFDPEGASLGISNVVTLASKFQTDPSLFPRGTLTTGAIIDTVTLGPSIGDVSTAGLFVLDASLNSQGIEPLKTKSVAFGAVSTLIATAQPLESYSALISGTIGRMGKSFHADEATQTQRLADTQAVYDDLSKVKSEEEFLSFPDLAILMNFYAAAQGQILEAKRAVLTLTRAI